MFFHCGGLAHVNIVTAGVVTARVIATGVIATNFGDLFWTIFDIALSLVQRET